jgi:O-antigen/teichoic acid export membrane protein
MGVNGLMKISYFGRIEEGQATFITNVSSTFLVQVLHLFLYLATTAILARWLGPEGKGTIALALLVPGMLNIFLSGGVNVANVYFAGSRKLDVSILTENSVKFTIFSTLLGIFIVGILIATRGLSILVPGIKPWLVFIAMVGLPFSMLNSYLSAILQGRQHILMVNVINLFQSISLLTLTVLFVIGLKMGLLGALLSYLGSGLVSLTILIIVLFKEKGVFRPHWNLSGMRSILSFGLKGHIGNIFQFFNYRADTFVLNYFMGAEGVGIYSVSVGLAELLWHFPNAVGFVIFPKAAATKPEVMNVFTSRILCVTLGVTTLGAVGLVILGRSIIRLIFSLTFMDAYLPMLVLLPGVIFLGGAKVLTNEIAGRGYPQYNSITAGVAFVLTILFDLIFIPRFGIIGASLASTISYSAIFFMAIGFYFNIRRRITGENTLISSWEISESK